MPARSGTAMRVAPAPLPVPVETLLADGVDIACQPIVHLGTGGVIAYEALARPRHEAARDPMLFFAMAESAGLRIAAERIAEQAVFRSLSPSFPAVKLFLNMSPSALLDDSFKACELVRLAERSGVRPCDVVIEVTEAEAVEDLPTLVQRARELRAVGVGMAVDDAGAGHASFRVITDLRPAYIKLDRELIAGLDRDGARSAFVEAMVGFARQIGSRLIAEGVETEAELVTLLGLRVDAAQGYFLARPTVGAFVEPSAAARAAITSAARRAKVGMAELTVADLMEPATVLPLGVRVDEAYRRFVAVDAPSTLVLVDAGRVVGQLSRSRLDRLLATPGAWDEVGHRPVRSLADPDVRTVGTELDIVELAGILASSDGDACNVDVVVSHLDGQIAGVVPANAILQALTEVRRHRDGDLNPMSGLAAASWIEADLRRRLREGEAVSVLFVDIDGFGRLNRLGGYLLGDDVIRAFARSLAGLAGGIPGAAVGHFGADDFVLLVPPRHFEELVAELVRAYEREVMPLARSELRIRGADDAPARLTVSMSAADLRGESPAGMRALDWARDQLPELQPGPKGHLGHTCLRHAGARNHLSTWTPRLSGTRTVSLGLVEPAVVLEAVAVVERSWEAWWAGRSRRDPAGFPGPLDVACALHERYARPLLAAAGAAQRRGMAVMEVQLAGDEGELLDLLDRVAVVIRYAYADADEQSSALTLLDRVLRMRARNVTRQDRTIRGG